ncbi:MAG: ATP-dependent protease subunit HslV [Planctomycetota bacterium]
MFRSTTILCVSRDGKTAIGGDGQVSLGDTIVKAKARKTRRLMDGKVVVGFAGSAADAFALMERFEGKLKDAQGNLRKAAHELAREWRTDKVLRRLESMLIAADGSSALLVSGSGDVIDPDDGVLGIGSGGGYAVAAARALAANTDLDAKTIVAEALHIAAGICVHTNSEIYVEEIA